jgi:GT2 family glycosyltransferase
MTALDNRPLTRARAEPAPRAGEWSPQDEFHEGFIDFFGYHAPSGGWYFVGWVRLSAPPGHHADTALTATFQLGQITGVPLSTFHMRPDLQGIGYGIVAFLPGAGRFQGALTAVELVSDTFKVSLPATNAVQQFRDHDLSGRVRAVLGTATGPNRARLLTLLARQGYAGQDTLAGLPDPVFMDFDEIIVCPPDGLVLLGWLLAKPGTVAAIRLRSGDSVCPIPLDTLIPISRPDVVDAVGRPYGLTRQQNGFIAFAPTGFSAAEQTYLEIETTAGQIAFKGIPAAKLTGLPAIRRILDAFEAQYVAIGPAYDHVIGPAIGRLNAERIAVRPAIDILTFGAPAAAPRFSIIIPLYGRIDFMEVQMALFARHAPSARFDFIYVLDDPPRRAETEILAESIWQRFRVPLTLLLLDANVGFASASNIGLHHARGDYICFLNSDVFPGTADWIERLADGIEHNPDIGCIGPLLQYEDGSVQHAGMEFAPLQQFGNWQFPLHTRKGWRPPPGTAMIRCDAITGAAMLMRKQFALSLGGFDEGFVIGDFEDADLCLRVAAAGLRCAVDPAIRLFHLERKSQTSPGHRWRLNMTLYNAWRHQRRWHAELARLAAPAPGLAGA